MWLFKKGHVGKIYSESGEVEKDGQWWEWAVKEEVKEFQGCLNCIPILFAKYIGDFETKPI